MVNELQLQNALSQSRVDLNVHRKPADPTAKTKLIGQTGTTMVDTPTKGLLPVPAFLREGERGTRQKCKTLLIAWFNTLKAAGEGTCGFVGPNMPASLSEPGFVSTLNEHNRERG